MKTPPHTPFQTAKAFTLIELLVVISIIAILASLSFPAMAAVQNMARKTQAKNDETQIIAAVKLYYTEYGKYPLLQAQTSVQPAKDVVFGDPSGTSNEQLFNVLRVPSWWTDTENQNPRKIVFMDGKDATDSNKPKGGFATSETAVKTPSGDMAPRGAFVDPWGNQYVVFIDANYDNNITEAVSTLYKDYSTTTGTGVNAGVGVASLGKDNKLGSGGKLAGSDDIVSWK